ncbi:hypothetical protein MMC07_009334 [Pseudocyphellaria aurata]|nr:hypothetical protein [Pseudocyphellaria aurata]
MPLKLLQAEQSDLINRRIPGRKAVVLNGNNNTLELWKVIATGRYTHAFTSPEITLSKQFKNDVLVHREFTNRLRLLAIDEIHLTEEWRKQFRPLYAEISKVRKRIPCQVPLLSVSTTLNRRVRGIVVEKAGFQPEYCLMQTSLDRPEIMQIHRFMKHPKTSCLDLQFILPEVSSEAKNIQKTIIFVNSVAEIFPIIDTIQSWMELKNYPVYNGLKSWIKPYFSAMSDYNKEMTANKFRVPDDENTDCTILVATDAYGMGINNPGVALVVQWDLSLSFDTMIQRMGRAGRKGGASTFVLFTPK